MTKFQIPDAYLTGFTELSKLTTNEAEEISKLLNKAPIGGSIEDYQNIFKETNISVNIQEVLETIFSLGSLLMDKKAGSDIVELASDLTSAYIEKKLEKIPDNVAEKLRQNLVTIFQNADNLKKSYKVFRLLSENAHIYRDSRIMTDVRLLFEDEVEIAPHCGVVLHQLKIEYLENEKPKSFFVCLDNEDVLKLIENLQRALKKEESIKANQADIKFITLK